MNYTHDQYLYGVDSDEHCPKCGCGWEPEYYEDNPYLQTWRCIECDYATSLYDGNEEYELLDEGDVTKQVYLGK